MVNNIINASIILKLLLFSTTSLLSLLLYYSSNNDHRSALALQQQSAISSSTNQSNMVLGAIASNLWADNPDAVVGGYHPPIYNASESKPDAPAKEKGFLVADEKPFNISYPSGWIKNKGHPYAIYRSSFYSNY